MVHNEAVLRGKFIALSAHIKKVEKAHTSKLTAQLKALEQKDADIPRWSKKQEKNPKLNRYEKNWNSPMYLIRSPWFRTRSQQPH